VSKVAGLVLAAGTSTRMGRPKQLLPVEGMSLLDRILVEALISELTLVVLVLGYNAQEIKEDLKTEIHHPKLKIIENRDYKDGISSSIITGLSEVEDEYDHCMIILADMPHITANIINRLLHQYLASRLPLGSIKIENRRSHPVIFGRKLYPEIHQLQGDLGARDLFIKYRDHTCLVEPEEDYNDMDIDTLDDYLEYKKSLGHV
jgi:molybdenum cofactor cytidylyltransferase